EPAHQLRHYPLKVACLPISPPGHMTSCFWQSAHFRWATKVKSFPNFNNISTYNRQFILTKSKNRANHVNWGIFFLPLSSRRDAFARKSLSGAATRKFHSAALFSFLNVFVLNGLSMILEHYNLCLTSYISNQNNSL